MKKISSLIALAIGITQMVFGSVHTIDSLDEITPYLKESCSATLIVFDIDETLVISEDPAFQRPNFQPCISIIKEILTPLTPLQRQLSVNMTLLNVENILIEKNTLGFLEDQKKRGIKMIALSAAMSGKLKGVDILEKRLRNFEKLGIDFSDSFPEVGEIDFDNLKSFYGAKPRFKKGILHSNAAKHVQEMHNSKGEVLIEFLKRVNFSPCTLIFVDDQSDLIKEMQTTIEKTHPEMEFLGFHYRGALHYPAEKISKERVTARWKEVSDQVKDL